MKCPKCDSDKKMIPGYKIVTREHYYWCTTCDHEIPDTEKNTAAVTNSKCCEYCGTKDPTVRTLCGNCRA